MISDQSRAGLYPGNAKKHVDPKTLMNQGLTYKFKLADLGKYSQKLKYRDLKFKKSALGKEIPEADDRERRLARISLLKDMLRDAKSTDWYHTLLYQQFQRNGRWKHEDSTIISELELRVLTKTLDYMLT